MAWASLPFLAHQFLSGSAQSPSPDSVSHSSDIKKNILRNAPSEIEELLDKNSKNEKQNTQLRFVTAQLTSVRSQLFGTFLVRTSLLNPIEERMNSGDPRVHELFTHIRRTVDIMEELALRLSVAPVQQSRPEVQQRQPSTSPSSIPQKLAYSIKEVRELIAISNSSIYKEIGEGRLRAVKRGNRTMILAADLQDWISSWPAS